MNHVSNLIRAIVPHGDKDSLSERSKVKEGKRKAGRKTKKKPPRRHQTYFYDPDVPDDTGSSSDDLGLADLDRRQTDTLNRVDDAEAALAKERKRMEQLEVRRQEVEAKEERRRMEQDDAAERSPRQKNRRAYERAVARVEKNALRKIEELDRRFAHSDKVFELIMARETESYDQEAAEEGTNSQRQNEYHHPNNVARE